MYENFYHASKPFLKDARKNLKKKIRVRTWNNGRWL